MKRSEVLNEIDRLLRNHCHGCSSRIQRGSFSQADVRCAKECDIGTQLQAEGKKLLEICREERETKKARHAAGHIQSQDHHSTKGA